MRMVLGFAFDDLGRVALIKKNRPDWQAGRLNGIGGKCEENESSLEAMVREFRKETGVRVRAFHWEHVGAMVGPGWHVDVYCCTRPEVRGVRTMTDEQVSLYTYWSMPDLIIENLPAMINLCVLPRSKRPFFTFKYSQ